MYDAHRTEWSKHNSQHLTRTVAKWLHVFTLHRVLVIGPLVKMNLLTATVAKATFAECDPWPHPSISIYCTGRGAAAPLKQWEWLWLCTVRLDSADVFLKGVTVMKHKHPRWRHTRSQTPASLLPFNALTLMCMTFIYLPHDNVVANGEIENSSVKLRLSSHVLLQCGMTSTYLLYMYCKLGSRFCSGPENVS